MNNSSCLYLDWDSNFWGIQIGRLVENRLDAQTVLNSLQWCADHRIDCLYYLADASDLISIREAENGGFRYADIRVTYTKELSAGDHQEDSSIRFALKSDLDHLLPIAGSAYRCSRFYSDPNFDRIRCNEFYKTWLANSLAGYASAIWVAAPANTPQGYVTCHRPSAQVGQIGLIGISEQSRGQGIGEKLLVSVERWLLDQGALSACVVTQGRNLSAQRFYEKCGYRVSSVQLWMHWWSSKSQRLESRR